MNRRRIKPINRRNNETGSPRPGEPVFVVVGQLRRPHGVTGEILMETMTNHPQRLRVGTTIYLSPDYEPLTIAGRRSVEKGLLLRFDGFTDCDQVAVLTNRTVFVRADSLPPLPKGEYYHHQLIGLSVLDESNALLGKIVEIIETGANDVYVVQPESGEEILLPALEDVILFVDLDAGQMRVRPPEWL
ncbi:MAG TPA: ribosome maturation factor RimM [Anaerolineaceae bacterium]|nr:ribosome maturation factor RimM [Anaerolineaceae bacterium]